MATAKKYFFHKLQAEVKVPDPIELTEDITIYPPTHEQLEAIQSMTPAQLADDPKAVEKVLFGENYEAVKDLFAKQDANLWKAFEDEVAKRFLPGAGDADTKGQ
jgi:hypothetical protein